MKNRFQHTITADEIAALPISGFTGTITVVEDEKQLIEACAVLRKQKAIGFDTETRPSFKAGVIHRVSLVQLSTADHCFLIRLCKCKLDRPLVKILESKKIIKVGADVGNDLRSLQKLRRFRADGFVDLQNIVSMWGIGEKSVRKMAGIILRLRISKAQRLSNWEASRLTEAQQMYAATDAWICLKMLSTLENTDKKPLSPDPDQNRGESSQAEADQTTPEKEKTAPAKRTRQTKETDKAQKKKFL